MSWLIDWLIKRKSFTLDDVKRDYSRLNNDFKRLAELFGRIGSMYAIYEKTVSKGGVVSENFLQRLEVAGEELERELKRAVLEDQRFSFDVEKARRESTKSAKIKFRRVE